MLLRLAWRNLWRNPRRTGLTIAAGVFAVVLTLVTIALSQGSHELWIDHVVRLYPGHVELSTIGYRDNRTLDFGMTLSAEQTQAFDALPGLAGWAPRLESWALAIPDRDDTVGRAAWLVGVAPERETRVSRLGSSVHEGSFLAESSVPEVVLGETLAENLGVGIGDDVILLAADYYGSQSADRFRVVGLLKVGDDRFDGYAALLRLETLQQFLEYPGGLSHVAFFVDEDDAIDDIRSELLELFSPGRHEILAWPELIPDLVQMIVLDDIGGYLSIAAVVLVVAFGLLNTILMSVLERVREFGVMRAMGVRPRAVFGLVMIESTLLTLIGIAIGVAISLPLFAWLGDHPMPMPGGEEGAAAMELFGIEPVIAFHARPSQVLWVGLVLLGVSLLAALPPAFRASRGRPVDALREI